MNYPAASGEVSPKDEIYFIVASDGVLDPVLRNKKIFPLRIRSGPNERNTKELNKMVLRRIAE